MKSLPIGVTHFSELIRGKDGIPYYRVDKTPLIREILSSEATVHWILQPRGFGKSLQLDMIQEFLTVHGDNALFNGLQIAQDQKFCSTHQGQYPVIYLDLGKLEGNTFDEVYASLSGLVAAIFDLNFPELQISPQLSEEEQAFCRMCAAAAPEDDKPRRPLSSPDLQAALGNLAQCLHKHYGVKPVLLVDNCDVPLHQAWIQRKRNPDWYGSMETLLQDLLRPLLADDTALSFAVLTSTLSMPALYHLSDPSHTKVWSGNEGFSRSYYGFTLPEETTLLADFGVPGDLFLLQRWCGGYPSADGSLFRPAETFAHLHNREKSVVNLQMDFWANSAREGTVVAQLLQDSGPETQAQYLRLMAGQTIDACRIPDVSYQDLEKPDGIWNFLLYAGTLIEVSREEETGRMQLKAPSLQARMHLGMYLERWFHGMGINARMLQRYCHAFAADSWDTVDGMIPTIWERLVQKKRGDTYYFGILFGILLCRWMNTAVLDCGDGYCGITVLTEKNVGIAAVLRYHLTETAHIEAQIALRQVKELKYPQALLRQGCEKMILFGLAWNGKEGSVVVEYPSIEYADQLFPE